MALQSCNAQLPKGPRGSCHSQSRMLGICYANMHRHTKLPQFLEEFTLGIFAFGLGSL